MTYRWVPYVILTILADCQTVDYQEGIENKDISLRTVCYHGSGVLAWDYVRQGSVNSEDGQNVVLQEFAHQLDHEDEISDGTPILENWSGYAVLARIMSMEYERLQSSIERHKKESWMTMECLWIYGLNG